jgi:hypothetical protein
MTKTIFTGTLIFFLHRKAWSHRNCLPKAEEPAGNLKMPPGYSLDFKLNPLPKNPWCYAEGVSFLASPLSAGAASATGASASGDLGAGADSF